MSARFINQSALLNNPRDSEGFKLCRWPSCGKRLAGRRRSWCSDECLKEYLVRSGSPRPYVFERDRGVCAICGADTMDGERTGPDRWRHRWEADHIVPVIEGGEGGLNNLRTLCLACHREATRELRRRLMERRRSQLALVW